ncbi:MAG: permease [Planctomycetota bacterium]|nr:MAG: permease [Planctomycetota bacterium]
MGASTRGSFLVKTYLHLLGAMVLFIILEVAIFNSGAKEAILTVAGQSWYLVFGAFILVSWIGSHVAHSAKSKPIQYLALVGFVSMWAIIFTPMIEMANSMTPAGDSSLLQSAVLMTLLAFSTLSAIVFFTGKDFAFMRSFLMFAGLVAFFTIIAAMVFGFQLGVGFSAIMVLFAGGAILYDTSEILHHYPEDRYVGASLQLFSSIALLFWYILRIFTSRD